MKKALRIALLCVLGLIVVVGVLVWMEFSPLVKGARSCEKLDNGLYYMEYKGDDGAHPDFSVADLHRPA